MSQITRFPSKRLVEHILERGLTAPIEGAPTKRAVIDVTSLGWAYKVTLDNGTHMMLPRVSTILNEHNKPALLRWKIGQVTEELYDVGADAFRLLRNDPTAGPADFTNVVKRLKSERGRDVEAAEKFADYGTRVHNWIQAYWTSILNQRSEPELPVPDALVPSIAGTIAEFKAWLSQHDVKPIAVEENVYSLTYGYVGRYDCLAWVDGHRTLLDWKTSSGVYLDHVLQNSAYRGALEEMDPLQKIQQGMIVRVPRDADKSFATHVVDTDQHKTALPTFRALVLLYHVTKNWEKEYGPAAKKKAGAGGGEDE